MSEIKKDITERMRDCRSVSGFPGVFADLYDEGAAEIDKLRRAVKDLARFAADHGAEDTEQYFQLIEPSPPPNNE